MYGIPSLLLYPVGGVGIIAALVAYLWFVKPGIVLKSAFR